LRQRGLTPKGSDPAFDTGITRRPKPQRKSSNHNRELQAAFADPEIDAIQTMRGGYGSAQ
jgi:muramoyltetrapeptide carboxypeptidase LdcA involved in peptidoglycan recycling